MHAFDLGSLSLVAAAIAILLGLLLIFFGRFQRVPALMLWGAAYILGGASAIAWIGIGETTHWLPALALQTAGILASGLVFAAARAFHGRRVDPFLVGGGAVLWFLLLLPFRGVPPLGTTFTLGAGVIAIYAGLTVHELLRERRRIWRGRWLVATISVAHAMILILPVVAGLIARERAGAEFISAGWVMAFAIELILYAVASAFIIMLLVTERAVQDHRNAALTDPLTGLLNRRGLAEAGGGLVSCEGRNGRGVSVLVCDLDHFKAVNDRFGHAAGDELLRLFARTIRNNVRASDLVARVGGEEFAIAMPCSLGEAAIAADRLRGVYAEVDASIGERQIATTVSIGVAGGAPGTPIDALIACADVALYRAKRKGRNRVEIAEDEPSALTAKPQMSAPVFVEREASIRVMVSDDLMKTHA